jgi:GNAT superfamily N-acetyltransferase
MNRHIDIVPIAQPPVQYVIFNEEGCQMAGYCLITANMRESALIGSKPIREAAIWHIYVDPMYRRLGFAKNLIAALKVNFDTIFTQGLTGESKRLLKSTGFEKSYHEGPKMWRWKRNAEPAK